MEAKEEIYQYIRKNIKEDGVTAQSIAEIFGIKRNVASHYLNLLEKEGKLQLIKAQAPLSEMSRYSIDLKSITQGRGKFTMQFNRYDEVPAQNATKIIAAAKASQE